MSKSKQLVIITHNVEDGIRQILFGLQYAQTMLNMDLDVSIFITGSAVKWTSKEVNKESLIDEFDSLTSYLELCIQLGGEILVCSACYEKQIYNVVNLNNEADSLINGTRLCGLVEMVEKSFDRDVTVY